MVTANQRLVVELGDYPGHPFRGNQWTKVDADDGDGFSELKNGVDLTDHHYAADKAGSKSPLLVNDERIQTGVPIKLTGLHVAENRGAEIVKNGFTDPMRSGGKAGAGTYLHIAGDRSGDYAHFVRAGNESAAKNPNARQISTDVTLQNPVVIRLGLGAKLENEDLYDALASARNEPRDKVWADSTTLSKTLTRDENLASPIDRAITKMFQEAGHDGLVILKPSGNGGHGSMAVVYDPENITIRDSKPLGAGKDKTLAAALEFGDYPGHPFRGNQWTKVEGEGSKESGSRFGDQTTRLMSEGGPAHAPYIRRMSEQLAKFSKVTGIAPTITRATGNIADRRGALAVTSLTEKYGLRIDLNPELLTKENLDGLSDKKFFSPGTSTPEGLITHEWAHAAVAQMTHDGEFDSSFGAGGRWDRSPYPDTGDVWRPSTIAVLDAFSNETGQYEKWESAANDVSRYAKTNASEFLAETYTDGKLNPGASEYAKQFADWFDGRVAEHAVNNDPMIKQTRESIAASIDGDWQPQWLEFGDYPGHPFRGNQWTDGAGEEKIDVEKFIAEHPRKDGEELFTWQGRVVADLSPQQQSDVLFHVRERYEPSPVVAEGLKRFIEEKGLPTDIIDSIIDTPVAVQEADAVARYFERTPDQSDDPKVIAAYEDFKRQSAEQWDFMVKPESEGGMGIRVEFTDKVNPYATAADQARDINENRRVVIESGLGGAHDATMTTEEYDRFRAVHDVFGHAGIGGGFDRHGEYQAWLVHAAMYEGAGRDAMSTEYHGVNSASWSGAEGSPGTGKSLLLPEKWSNPPWDREGLTAAGVRSTKAAEKIASALDLDAAFARRFDKLPWHPLPKRKSAEFGDYPGHPFRGNQHTDAAGGDKEDSGFAEAKKPRGNSDVERPEGTSSYEWEYDLRSLENPDIAGGTQGNRSHLITPIIKNAGYDPGDWVDETTQLNEYGDELWPTKHLTKDFFDEYPAVKAKLEEVAKQPWTAEAHGTTVREGVFGFIRLADRLYELGSKTASGMEFGDYPGHPFRGNQWTDGEGGSSLDVFKGPARTNEATMSAFSKEIQDKISSNLEKKFGVTAAQGKANIEALLDRAKGTAVWAAGSQWYQKANDDATEIAAQFGLSEETIVGAFAAISPGKYWDEEEVEVRAMAEYVGSDQPLNLSDDRMELLNAQLEAIGERAENGTKFSEFSDRGAVFAMRQQYLDDGGAGWGIGKSYDNYEKGVSILRGADPDDVLNGVKVRSFYNNIGNPDDPSDVTVDIQMVQAFANDKQAENSSSVMGAPSISRKGEGKTEIGPTPLVADVLREVASSYDIIPQQAQAIAWMQWKAENPPASKR